MSASITRVSDGMYYKISPPTFQNDPDKGTARISFFVKDRLIHDQEINVHRNKLETKSTYTILGKVRGYDLKTSLELLSTETLKGFHLDPDQLEKATETALGILHIY